MGQFTVKKKTLLSAAVLAATLIATAVMIFRYNDAAALKETIVSAKPEYLAAALCCAVGFVLCEAANIGRVLSGIKAPGTGVIARIRYAAAGFFFSGLTPFASGGQPAQLVCMKEDGVELPYGTLALLVEGMTSQVSAVAALIIGVFLNYRYLLSLDTVTKTLLAAGAAANAGLLILLVLLAFSRAPAGALKKFALYVTGKVSKNRAEERKATIEKQFEEYRQSAGIIKKHRGILVRNVLTSLAQMFMMCMIPFLVFRALGISSGGFIQTVSLQAVLIAGVSLIPLPGSNGAWEGGFRLIYSALLPQGKLAGAMILSRGISYYAAMMICGGFLLVMRPRAWHAGCAEGRAMSRSEVN